MADELFGVPAEQSDKLFGVPADQDDKLFGVPADQERKKQFYDDTTLGELGEGIASGIVGIGEGVIGLGATVVDLAAGTEYADKVTAGAEAIRDVAGLDPKGFIGKGSEVITQFVAPGLGVASKVGKMSKAARAKKGLASTPLTKAERFGLAVKEGAAFAATEAFVSTDNTTTIGDWINFDPTKTTELIGLEGREKALARLTNRIKVAGESAGLGAAIQGGVSLTGKTAGQLAETTVGQAIKGSVKQKLDNVGQSIDNFLYRKLTDPDSIGKGKQFIADAIAFTRYRGYLPERVARERLLLDGKIQNQLKKADRVLNDLDINIKKTLESFPETSPLKEVELLNKIDDFLTETDTLKKQRLFKELPNNLKKNAQAMRSHVDKLSNDILDTEFLKRERFVTKDGQSVNDLIKRNVGSYLRKQYKIFTDSKYVPTKESIKVADDYFKSNKDALEKELTDLARKDFRGELSDDFLRTNKLSRVGAGDEQKIVFYGDKVSDQLAQKARETFLKKYSFKNRDKLTGGRVARDRLDTGIFVEREEIPQTLRALLGEVKDPRESYLSTVADLAQFTAIDDYFSTITKLSKENSLLRELFVDGSKLSPLQRKGLKDEGFVQLGGEEGASSIVSKIGKEGDPVEKMIGRSGWGQLDDYYVRPEIYKDLTRQVIGDDNVGGQVLRGIFSTFLRGKALTQYSKTILSPITQIRNVLTAITFATANGNIPFISRGGSLKDAVRLVYNDIRNKGDDAIFKELEEARELGVLGTNAELKEIQDSLRKGVGGYADDPRNPIEAIFGKNISDKVKKVTKPAEDIYQGSDDLWKSYNYKIEKSKIRNALKDSDLQTQIRYLTEKGDIPLKSGMNIDDLIKERAAQIVRDTVPNYNKAASGLVTVLRKAPFGNFIVFPMEIYRTSFNIMKQALDDMASDIPGVKARGRQRLLGLIGTTAALPIGMQSFGYAVSGVSKEEMEAYQRYFSPSWEKGAVLIPIGKDEEGKIQYINFSTSNPYDTIGRSLTRFLREADTAIEQGKTPGQVLTDVAFGSVGEFLEPFFSEAMLTESILDITIRGGRSATGAEVYDKTDNVGDKAGKIIAHLMNTAMPNLVPFDLESLNPLDPKLKPKKILRGTIGQVAPGLVDPQTKIGREITLNNVLASFIGVAPQEFNPKKGLEFGAFRMQRAQNDARSQFNTLTDDANIRSSQLEKGFLKANQAKLRVDREYYQMLNSLRKMGLKDSQIRKVLKDNNIGGYKSILRGVFTPFKISKNNIKELRRNGLLDQLPRREIREIQKSYRNVRLDEPGSRPSPIQNPNDNLFGVPAN